MVLDTVVKELAGIAERERTLESFETKFLDLLAESDVEWVRHHTAVDERDQGKILRRLRHLNDLPIALELQAAKPDYFVHSNPDHWTNKLDDLLGTTIATPREFLIAHGIEPPPPLQRRR